MIVKIDLKPAFPVINMVYNESLLSFVFLCTWPVKPFHPPWKNSAVLSQKFTHKETKRARNR